MTHASSTSVTRSAGTVAVYGAGGHTGGFVVDELVRRAIPVVAVGRSAGALRTGMAMCMAPLDDPAALAHAFSGCAVVINCAGPFLDTAAAIASATLAADCHYLDVTAEQESARTTLRDFDAAARGRGLAVIPAAGFFGGLADLLATRLAGDASIDAITVAIALDRWWPTPGTRRTGERNVFPRVIIEDGALVPLSAPTVARSWEFGPPLGARDVMPVPLSEIVAFAHHLPVRRAQTYLDTAALRDLRDPETAAPSATDPQGRSAQRFALQVQLEDRDGIRRATAHGRDIYAVSAPLVVEAAARLLRGGVRAGAHTLGAAFDARTMLRALAPAHFFLATDGD